MIRAARADDVDRVVALEAATQDEDAWSENLVRDGITGGLPTISYLVAEVDGEVAGYAVASYAGDIAELQRIGVDETARRRGLATALLDAVVVAAPATGANRLLLEVREDNAGALAFYAARGFVEIDRRPRYYRDGATAVVMRRPLLKGCGY
ncbi:ribosomal protein S18-alanine N-acetyltransferase [Marmoricola sp. RAF53]|uniref:ribosomal protein S18-alanine N-acetyltransferase n=1 Tax=Marmoricola sp. RAF53 TaxID=3233059 RepID=UPI003F9B5C0D